MKSLAHVCQFVSRGLALQLYQRLIVPHMDYGDVVYDAIGTVNSQKLQTFKINASGYVVNQIHISPSMNYMLNASCLNYTVDGYMCAILFMQV